MSLVARYLEAAGVPTVIIGSARDIVEECGVARFLFVDFPLGNPCGKPWDVGMQNDIVAAALTLLEKSWEPRTTVQRSEIWNAENDTGWRETYMLVDATNRDALARAGEERRRAQAERKAAKTAG